MHEVIVMKRVKFLYNPQSGDGKMRKQLDVVFWMYQKYGYQVDVLRLDENSQEMDLFPEPVDTYDHVLIAGGDGTCDIIVNEMLARGIETPVAFLPMGTSNDYATYIGMTQNVEESLRQILTLPPQQMDLGKVNDRYFLNVFAGGYFTDFVQRTDNDLKTSIGYLAYVLKSFEVMRELRTVKVRITAKEAQYEGDMLFCTVFNGISVGRMKLAMESRGNDGLLDVIVLKTTQITELGPTLIKILRGDESALADPGVLFFQTKDVTIESLEPIPTDVDGEKGPELPVRIECASNRLTVLGVSAHL